MQAKKQFYSEQLCIDFNIEEWRDIEGYEERYQVSSFGRIRTIGLITGNRYHREFKKCIPKIKSQCLGSNGYLYASFKGKRLPVHRFVALAFVANPDEKAFVNHKDGNKRNNNSNNLEWVTRSENAIHAYAIGLAKRTMLGKFGEKHPNSKKVSQYTTSWEFIKTHDSVMCAARENNVADSSIHKAIRKNRTCGGYRWKFI